MGYDFSCGAETFRWSGTNWERLLEMFRRTGADLPWEELRKQVVTISPAVAEDMAQALARVIEEKMLPDMNLTSPIGKWTKKVMEEGTYHEGSWGFGFPWSKSAMFIHDDDPRWQGIFFHHMVDFMFFLQYAVSNKQDISVS